MVCLLKLFDFYKVTSHQPFSRFVVHLCQSMSNLSICSGSYHDKITHLDNALQNFTRLQNLDLARNALLSLDGLSHLRHLESLNLYYNNVCDLDELYKLKQNKKLENIDLRLNPGSQAIRIHFFINIFVSDQK